MSIDVLQEKIRKKKSAFILDMNIIPGYLPCEYKTDTSIEKAIMHYSQNLIDALKDFAAAARFDITAYALIPNGMEILNQLMTYAKKSGLFVILGIPGVQTVEMADYYAQCLFAEKNIFPCNGVQISAYNGTDTIEPFILMGHTEKKSVFATIRTSNRLAFEIQDLLTGSRLVHQVAAANIAKVGESYTGKYHYSDAAIVASATSAQSIKELRSKYPGVFIVVDGMTSSGANMKNASFAFDKLGRGAAVCMGENVTAAWKFDDNSGRDCIMTAFNAAEKMKKNLQRYINIL